MGQRFGQKLGSSAEEVGLSELLTPGDPMSQKRLPPPQPDNCLIHSRKSKYKGGTLIAEDVGTLEEHRRRLCDPDGYRPESCDCCGHGVLHVHDYPERRPLGLALTAAIRLVRFICARATCRATWRVLPAFLARHLWWSWGTIERATREAVPAKDESESSSPSDTKPPVQTVRRWLGRLESSARQAVVLMGSRGTEVVRAVAETTGLADTRRALVDTYQRIIGVGPGHGLGAVAAVLDRLERGIRLM